jgi:hypothetical protein
VRIDAAEPDCVFAAVWAAEGLKQAIPLYSFASIQESANPEARNAQQLKKDE